MSHIPQRFSGESLLSTLNRLPRPDTYWLGFSGGADSTALLVALHELGPLLEAPVRAVHFNHGLSADADLWMQHCRDFCAERNIPFTGKKLVIRRGGGTSLEEAARDSRYAAIAGLVAKGDLYLTAHHGDDQAETLFLNLMRGSGVEGLAGIPELRKIGQAWVARPLLEENRERLESFLRSRGIDWLEDPSNKDEAFDRNFLRRKLFPLLEQRWPGVSRRLSRTARHARLTSASLARYIDQHAGEQLHDDLELPLDVLLQFDRELQPLVLRQWLRRREVPALPETRIHEFLNQVNADGRPGQAEIRWGDWLLKRYRESLYLLPRDLLGPCPEMAWTGAVRLALGAQLGALEVEGGEAGIPDHWTVRARVEGDGLQLNRDGPRRKIRRLLQECAIPPWLRQCIPVLCWEGEPVAVGDWMLAPRLREWLQQQDATYRWLPTDPLLAKLQSDCHDFVVDRAGSLS
jgi:tRNA(Ile)-lysidine synthase